MLGVVVGVVVGFSFVFWMIDGGWCFHCFECDKRWYEVADVMSLCYVLVVFERESMCVFVVEKRLCIAELVWR